MPLSPQETINLLSGEMLTAEFKGGVMGTKALLPPSGFMRQAKTDVFSVRTLAIIVIPPVAGQKTWMLVQERGRTR
jgi:hypothetical protein